MSGEDVFGRTLNDGPWIAYARSQSSWKSAGTPTDHATEDGKTTLCGIKEVGGSSRETPFDRESGFSCKRCVRALLAESGR